MSFEERATKWRYAVALFFLNNFSDCKVIYLKIEGEISPKGVAIYYTEKERNENHNIIRELEMDEFRNISNWPEGFFEEDYGVSPTKCEYCTLNHFW
ncbi:DUF3696 domain-containing protein [Bacillus sp. dmp10]|uniref:DUF3696 domain-containing protein n=1 Tax=Bacillus sp. dmp10 TaxID=2293321 RepID=UPI000E2E8C2C|nr:DUF3696 domain-containing protein [Bacillus sp. dmp10]